MPQFYSLALLSICSVSWPAVALRAKEQGLRGSKAAEDESRLAEEELGLPYRQAPGQAQAAAAVKRPGLLRPGDFREVVRMLMPKGPTATPKSPKPEEVRNLLKQMMSKASVQAPATRPSPTQVGLANTAAVHKAAEEAARAELGNFVARFRASAEKAQKHTHTASEQDELNKEGREAAQNLNDVWRQLMAKASSSALQAAEEEAPKLVENTLKAEEKEDALSKGAIEASIAEAEEHLRAAEAAAQAQTDIGVKEAAEQAARAASEKAMESLLNWADHSTSGSQEAERAKASAPAPETVKEIVTAKQPSGQLPLERAVEAARHAKSPEEFRMAWAAVQRAFGAASKVQQDSRRALVSSGNAVSAVSRSIAEVGRKAVSEVMREELALLAQVAEKARKAPDDTSAGAWVQGLLTSKRIAEDAWTKGLMEGFKTVPTEDILAKIQGANADAASATAVWAQVVGEALASRDTRYIISKAAEAATKAASVAAAEVSKGAWEHLRVMAEDMVMAGPNTTNITEPHKFGHPHGANPPEHYPHPGHWHHMKPEWPVADPGIKVESQWTPDGIYRGALKGNMSDLSFRARLMSGQNDTHRVIRLSGAVGNESRVLHGHVKAMQGVYPFVSNEVRGMMTFNEGKTEAGMFGDLRADPLYYGVSRLRGDSKIWNGSTWTSHELDAVVSDDGRYMGKVTHETGFPGLPKPIHVVQNFSQLMPLKLPIRDEKKDAFPAPPGYGR